jgi:RsiW-degrading membrane proteinase PrsW (M82 family)
MIPLSLFLGLYIGLIYWLCFSALLLLYISAYDFTEARDTDGKNVHNPTVSSQSTIAESFIVAFYRSVICGILISILIKASVIYLDVDSPSFFAWLIEDLLTSTGFREQPWNMLGGRQIAAQTSFMFLFTILSVSYLGIYRVRSSVDAASTTPFVSHIRLWAAPVFMVVSFQLIGAFIGFSILLVLAILIGIWQLLSPSLQFKIQPAKATASKEPNAR